MADIENQHNPDVVLFAAMFFAVQTILLIAVSSSSPSEVKCRLRVGPLVMSLSAGLVQLMAIVVASVSLVEVMAQLRKDGVLVGNWRFRVMVAGNVVVAVCFAVFMWMIYNIPCHGVRLN